MQFDSFTPAHWAFGLPIYVARVDSASSPKPHPLGSAHPCRSRPSGSIPAGSIRHILHDTLPWLISLGLITNRAVEAINTLPCCLTRDDAERFFYGPRVINFAALDHGRDLIDVVNILGRVTVDEHHVGELSGCDQTSIFVDAHHQCRS